MEKVCKTCNINLTIDKYRSKISKGIKYQNNKKKIIDLKVNDPDKYNTLLKTRANKDKSYYENNKERINERNNKYYDEKKTVINIQRKIYRFEHPELMKEQRKKFLKNNNNKIAQSLRKRIRSLLGSGKKAPELLGCTISEFLEWLQFNFELDNHKEMNFNNYGIWELDHVKPCAKFNLENETELKNCFNWKNIAPLLQKENRSKTNKICNSHILRQEIRIYLFKQSINTAH